MKRQISALLIIVLSVLVLCGPRFAQAESLRNRIANRIDFGSDGFLLDTEKLHAFDHTNPLDPLFNNSAVSNTTNAIWREIPSWLRYTLGVTFFLTAVIICFFGARIQWLSVFVLGGFSAALVMFAIMAAAIPNSFSNKTAIVLGCAGGAWVLIGGLLACYLNLAIFVLGAGFGVMASLAMNSTFLKFVWTAQPLANLIVWAILFGLVGGLIACCLKKPILVVATAGGGAFGIVYSIVLMADSLDFASGDTVLVTTWEDWTAFAFFLAITIFGALIQLFCTMPSEGEELSLFTKLE